MILFIISSVGAGESPVREFCANRHGEGRGEEGWAEIKRDNGEYFTVDEAILKIPPHWGLARNLHRVKGGY